MNKKRLLSKTIAVFSCILVGISSITATAAGTYNSSNDVWKFRNTNLSFGDSYIITEQDGIPFRKNLSNVDRRLAVNLIGGQFFGSCYGMAATSILASQGLIDYGAYTENTDSLYSMSGVAEVDDKPSDEILSLINYYACLQFTEEVRQYTAYSMLEQTDADRLQQIIENAEQGVPTLVCYFGAKNDTEELFGHAVVAYDVEYDQFKSDYSEKSYMGRILIYDCNNGAEKCYIYFNDDNSWETENCSSENDGRIELVISDIDLINNKGLIGGTEPYNNGRAFMPLLTVDSLTTNKTVQKVSFDNGSWTAIDSVEGQINQFSAFLHLGDVPQIDSNTYVLKDADSGYVLSSQGANTMSAQMNYQNSFLMANVTAGDQIVFDPSGYIEVNGDNTSFSLEMAFNEGYYNGNWHNITVEGAADDVSLFQTDEGYILKSDTLTEFFIIANDGEKLRNRYFDLSDFDSVLIFEKDDRSIGLAADMDKNGSYEIVLHQPADGDVNNDSVLNASDVVLLKKWLLKFSDAVINNWEAADMNYDNKLDVFDFCMMKKALLSMENEVPPPYDEEKDSIHELLQIDVDETYDNITATALQDVYSSDTSEISCDLKNKNVGKGFYFFVIPFLEKYKNGNWIQLYNGTSEIRYSNTDGSRYLLCGIADHEADDIEFSTRVKIQTKNLTPELTKGHYRFKIYTPKNILYAEFDVADTVLDNSNTTTEATTTTTTTEATTIKTTTTAQTTTTSVTTTQPVTTKPFIRGDISGNNKIDLYDAIEIAKFLVGKRTFVDDEITIADYNADGKVDLYDAIKIAETMLKNMRS